MNNLIQTLLSIKNPRNNFIERPELIQGYTEDEIKQIEQKYNIPIYGQFKELLMTMGKCSGGLLFGDEIYIYIYIEIQEKSIIFLKTLPKMYSRIYRMIQIAENLLKK